ncbi:hypothetical protein AZA_48826 [Nitrospirillum viridazoti Y2]|nr:hypothetical protein AZA_48826 [Nitrospirillum amazonense Y2]
MGQFQSVWFGAIPGKDRPVGLVVPWGRYRIRIGGWGGVNGVADVCSVTGHSAARFPMEWKE